MIISLCWLAFGLVFLILGADYLIKASCAIAQKLNISPLIVGLTVVAFGTSAPELFVSVGSALKGNADFAIGNVVGSNIFNILGIIGIAVILKPITFSRQLVNREIPIMLFVLGLFYWFASTGYMSRVHGLILLVLIVAYVAYLIIGSKQSLGEALEGQKNWSIKVACVVVAASLLVMVGSSTVIIDNAVLIARSIGVSDLVIGITILAVGTSLPELAATYSSTKQGHPDLAVGNAVGSNIFNVLTVIGLTCLIQPLVINPSSLRLDFPMMFFGCLAFWLLILWKKTLGKREGFYMLGLYALYVTLSVFNGAVS